MERSDIKVYGYRWVVLLVFFLINALMQMQWITFAPITSEAVAFYKVPALQIDLLSLMFMIVYLFVSYPGILYHRHMGNSDRDRNRRRADGYFRIHERDFTVPATIWYSSLKSGLLLDSPSFLILSPK